MFFFLHTSTWHHISLHSHTTLYIQIILCYLECILYYIYTHFNICHPHYRITSKKLLRTSPRGTCQPGGLKGENWIRGTILKYPCHPSDITPSNLISYHMLSHHFLLSSIPQRPVTLCLVYMWGTCNITLHSVEQLKCVQTSWCCITV